MRRKNKRAIKVAAYQAPYLPSGSVEAVALIRKQIDWCESNGVTILCCPEAILGGLADYAANPGDIAINVDSGELNARLAPLASDSVTTIIGFTEGRYGGRLYNSAAVFHQGRVVGLYRKLHPAINRSVYEAGTDLPVFNVDNFTFGILICNDSNFPEIASNMASRGAAALFIPSNNGLPPEKADVVDAARAIDIACARDNNVWVVRADVAGRVNGMISHGSSAIIDPGGKVIQAAGKFCEDLLVAELQI